MSQSVAEHPWVPLSFQSSVVLEAILLSYVLSQENQLFGWVDCSPGFLKASWLPKAVSHPNILLSISSVWQTLTSACDLPGLSWRPLEKIKYDTGFSLQGTTKQGWRAAHIGISTVISEGVGQMLPNTSRALSQLGDSGRRSEGGDPWNEASSMSVL